MKRPVMLMILDGFGNGKEYPGNARTLAKMPFYNELIKRYPTAELDASGLAVGLPAGQMGNSEVGHMNIGAGRIMYQELTRITKEIEEGAFFNKDEFLKAVENVKNKNSSLHLMGLLSDGGVHSHINHLFALLRLAKDSGLKNIYVHCFMDGRDVAPDSGISYIEKLEAYLKELGVGKIASVCGRYYGMDRDKRWDRVKLAYDVIVKGEGIKTMTALSLMEKSYEEKIFDEFIMPTVITDALGRATATINDADSVIFFNFRPDRAREITRAIVDSNFSEFSRESINPFFVCMTQYDETIPNTHIAYKNEAPKNTIGEYVSDLGLNQLRIAETEKYAHVTFFLNGGREEPFKNEDRILVPSPKVATYDLQPEMSALTVTDKVVEAIESEKYDLIVLNYANPDMVGHTGSIPAVVKALEFLDACIKRVYDAIEDKNGALVITADHGNCETMLDENNHPVTSHTTNLVPVTVIGTQKLLKSGKLCDLSPTLLELMGLNKPEEMTGHSLLY